jgi:hypothetical protein
MQLMYNNDLAHTVASVVMACLCPILIISIGNNLTSCIVATIGFIMHMVIIYDMEYVRRVYNKMKALDVVPLPNWEQIIQQKLMVLQEELLSAIYQEGPAKYLARPAAITARTAADICPITLEPLTVYTSAFVGTCGHVGGPEITKCEKCPSCLEHTGWTEITFPT